MKWQKSASAYPSNLLSVTNDTCLNWPQFEVIHYSSSNTEPLQGLLNVTGFVICQSRVTPKYSLAAFKGTTFIASLLNKELFPYTSTYKVEHRVRRRGRM